MLHLKEVGGNPCYIRRRLVDIRVTSEEGCWTLVLHLKEGGGTLYNI